MHIREQRKMRMLHMAGFYAYLERTVFETVADTFK